jgi:hypothetical protein
MVVQKRWAYLNVTSVDRKNSSLAQNLLFTDAAVYGTNSPANVTLAQLILVVNTNVDPVKNTSYETNLGCAKYENAMLPLNYIALVSRGECTFDRKIQVAVESKARAIFVFNDQPDVFTMLVRSKPPIHHPKKREEQAESFSPSNDLAG